VFLVTDFRREDCLPLAVGLGYLLSTKIISSQSFVQAIVAEPGGFELSQWRLAFQKGRSLLRQHCDTVVVNSAKKVLNDLADAGCPISDYFAQEADTAARVIELFAELTFMPGLIGVDFSDVVIHGMGEGVLAYGHGQGENAAGIAVDKALSQLQYDLADWDDSDIGLVLANLSGSDFLLAEFDLVGNMISSFFNASVCVKIGSTIAPQLPEDERRVKLLAVAARPWKRCESERRSSSPWKP
jgi:cell division GTPase FtsZ